MLVTFEAKKPSRSNDQPSNTSSSTSHFADTSHHIVDDKPIIHNLDSNNPPDSKIFHFTKKKFKGGCITCKIRKKRCNEERPICSDCKRLGKNCVWATEDMSSETVRELKRKVEEEENNAKKKKLEKPLEPKKKSDVQTQPPSQQRQRLPNPSQTERATGTPTHHQMHAQHQFQAMPALHPLQQAAQDDEENDNPLDTEAHFPRQTPVSANLLNFPQRSQHSVSPPPSHAHVSTKAPALSPKWDNLGDHFAEFNSFFESNIRNNMNKYSDKITPVDDDATDQKEQPQPRQEAQTQVAISRPSPLFNLESMLADTPFLEFLNMNNIPSPMPSLGMPQELNMDPMGVKLYDYYCNRLSGLISIAPPESNHYTKVFLPMAMVNPGVLYSILAWSGYHMGGEFEREGTKYMDKALDYIDSTPVKTDGDALQRLANLLIMIGAEICKGDVRKWPVFLQWGAKIIKDRGGLYKFNGDKEQHWLISSFAYHDILASSTSERGTYFSVEDYDNFIVNFGFGVDPLQGIVKPLFNIIGEISTLATETKRLLKISSNSLGYGIMNDDDDDPKGSPSDEGEIPGLDTPESNQADKDKKPTRYSSLLTIMQKASALENKINNVRPAAADLEEFNEQELELQLTLFESFQLTAKLHLRQSVLRLNPSSLETQFILCELLKCLDVVLKSPVESSLCFPLFIAGMNCTTKKDRRMMLERFQDIIERYSFKNLERAKTIMEQVWFIDPSGTRCVDWYEIVKRLGWDISFA